MQEVLKRVRGSEFLRHNAVFFFGSVAVGALNYLYYPVLGRLLEPASFGEVQTLVSLFLQLVIFLNVLGSLTVNIIANNGDKPEAQKTVLELEKLALFISVVGLALTVALGPVLQRFFQFESFIPFVFLSIAVVVTVPFTFRSSYLRGKQLFAVLSFANLIGALSKLLLSALFVIAGFGTIGAIIGLVLAQAISFFYAASKASRAGFGPVLRTRIFRLLDMKLILPELKYALLVLAGSLTITALYSVDMIAVKHFFDAHTAGLYAGVATVARIIFFLTGSIALVLMPSIKLGNTMKQNRSTLLKSTYLMLGVGGAALLFFIMFPSFVMSILMGNEYSEYAHLLPKLSIVVFIISLLNLFILYFVALRRYPVSFIAIIGLTVTCGLVGINHDSLQAIVDSMLYGTLLMGCLLSGWAVWRGVLKHKGEGISS